MTTIYEKNENPYTTANFVSKATFWWINQFFKLGASSTLEQKDLYDVLPSDTSEILGINLASRWEAELRHCYEQNLHPEKAKVQPSLGKVLVQQFRARYMLIGILVFVEECMIRIGLPVCLGYLIRYFNGQLGSLEGYLLAAAIVLGSVVYIFTHHPFFFAVQHVGMQVRVACCALIYRKALRLSQVALCDTTIWQLVNLLSTDVNRFDRSTIFLHYIWIGPIQTVIVTVILWTYFGPSCLVGIGILLVFLFLQGFMGKKFAELRAKAATLTLSRIRIMNEILNGIRNIKMYTWEKAFALMIADARKQEIEIIRKSSYLRALNLGISYGSAKIMVLLTLATYVLIGNILTAEQVFVTLALYNAVRPVMTLFFPAAISLLSEAMVSVHRIENFLLLADRVELISDFDKNNDEHKTHGSGDLLAETSTSIIMKQFCAKWNPTRAGDTLSSINITVGSGELICLVGPVGSGKGSILHAILKELPATSGSVVVNGSVAYSSQEPWVFAGTIKENILFGSSRLDEAWYQAVIESCALTVDFVVLPLGDQTALDDKASALSSGQKARISLARAVYAKKDIYLLDDPLSVVEPDIARHIYEKCINGILKDKLRVLITHQVQFLKPVARILVISGGKVAAEGTYDQVIRAGAHLPQIRPFTSAMSLVSNLSAPGHVDIGSVTRVNSVLMDSHRDRAALSVEGRVLGQVIPVVLPNDVESVGYSQTKTTKNETDSDYNGQNTGRVGCVKCTTYYEYFHVGSSAIMFSLLIVINVVTMIFFTASDYWLQIWARNPVLVNGTFVPPKNSAATLDPNVKLVVYAVLVSILIVLSIGRTLFFFYVALKSSLSLHDAMFRTIIRAPMTFFEKVTAGKILNRFSKAVGITDETLPHTYMDAIEIVLTVLGVMIIIAIVNATLLIPAALLLIAVYLLRRFYMFTAREIKSIEADVRSPVFAHLSATLQGLTTIRAYGAENELIRQFDAHQDRHTAAWFLLISTTRWFGIWLDCILILYLTLVTYSFMFGWSFNDIDAAIVGLTISSVMMLTGMCEWGVRQTTELEYQMISVERILDYIKTESEAPSETKLGRGPTKNWPSKGEISLTNLSLQYGDTLALLNINCQINASEKVGIVGRTRASKISLINVLFRIVEPSTGDIKIDNLSILKIGLHDLRSKLSIIPQESYLFEGTLRSNLDPYSNHTDSEIWKVLQDVSLYEIINREPDGLEQEVSEDGKNFSIATKQLICIGRAYLEQNKIILLDEPTAKLDNVTDALIQKTIRQLFQNCTVITVANRLNTVMDSDRIMVLSENSIEEYDAPWTLLKNQESALYHLAQETGKTSMGNLMRIAKQAWESSGNGR